LALLNQSNTGFIIESNPKTFLHGLLDLLQSNPVRFHTLLMARAELGLFPSRAPPSELNLPVGFRFFPTDQELVLHYLSRKSPMSASSSQPNERRSKGNGSNEPTIIADVELYKFDPWNLPGN
jgi:hypothetical protein